MSELSEPILSKDETWKAHVLKAQASRLSDANYCRKNDLSMWTFTSYKKKLGLTKPRKPKSVSELNAFVRAVATPTEQKAPTELVNPLHSGLPDATWLADFACALLATKK